MLPHYFYTIKTFCWRIKISWNSPRLPTTHSLVFLSCLTFLKFDLCLFLEQSSSLCFHDIMLGWCSSFVSGCSAMILFSLPLCLTPLSFFPSIYFLFIIIQALWKIPSIPIISITFIVMISSFFFLLILKSLYIYMASTPLLSPRPRYPMLSQPFLPEAPMSTWKSPCPHLISLSFFTDPTLCSLSQRSCSKHSLPLSSIPNFVLFLKYLLNIPTLAIPMLCYYFK